MARRNRMVRDTVREPNVWKGIVAGVAGGLAATWAMSEAQALWTRAVDGREPQSAAGRHDARDWQERTEGQNSNEIAAQTVAEHTVGRPLDRRELAVGAAAVHYAFGSAAGALYGALAEMAHPITNGGGLGYGTFVWAAADEMGMPALGLSGPTTERPLEAHAQSLTAHLVFGLTLEAVRRTVRGRI
jgi:putative membrane protein